MKTIKISFFTACLCVVMLFFICSCSNIPPKEEKGLDLNEVCDLNEENLNNDQDSDQEVQPSDPSTESIEEDVNVSEDTQSEDVTPVEQFTEDPKDLQPQEVVPVEPSKEEPDNIQSKDDTPVDPPLW